MIKEEIITIELVFVNAYLIKTDTGSFLVDTGLSMHWEKLESILAAIGCLPDQLRLVILTHGDLDHAGNCAKLQSRYHCPVAMHRGDAEMVEQGVKVKRKTRTFRGRFLSVIRRLFRKKFQVEFFKPDFYLEDQQRLDKFGLGATIIHLPGHTKGSIGILTDEGNFFAGDLFVNTKKPTSAIYVENELELEKSLKRIKSLQINTIFPGHGKPFELKKVNI